MSPYIYDLLILALVILFTLRGRKKGFVMTLFGFLAMAVATVGAALLTFVLAEPVAQLLLPLVEGQFVEAMGAFYTEAGAAMSAALAQALASMESSSLLRGLLETVHSALESGLLEAGADVAQNVVLFMAVRLARLVLFPIFFVLITLVWGMLSRTLDLAFHLPGLNFLNRTAGAVLGLAEGLLLAYVLCWLLKDTYLTPSMVEGSLLLPLVYRYNPLLYIPFLNW